MTFMYLQPPSKILCSFIILSSSKIQHPLSTIYLYNVYSFSCPFNLSLSFITIIHFPIPLSISINPYSYTRSAILVSFFMYLHKSTFIYLLKRSNILLHFHVPALQVARTFAGHLLMFVLLLVGSGRILESHENPR